MDILNALLLILSAHQAAGGQEATTVAKNPPPNQVSARPDPLLRNNPATWVTPDDYPSKALREELEGSSRFNVIVDKKGRVTNCAIVRSSGHAILDARTCELVSQRARFRPALDENGNPIVSSYTNIVRWTLPEAEPISLAEDSLFIAKYSLNKAREIESCQDISIGDNFSELNFISCEIFEESTEGPSQLIDIIPDEFDTFEMRFMFYQKGNAEIEKFANLDSKFIFQLLSLSLIHI